MLQGAVVLEIKKLLNNEIAPDLGVDSFSELNHPQRLQFFDATPSTGLLPCPMPNVSAALSQNSLETTKAGAVTVAQSAIGNGQPVFPTRPENSLFSPWASAFPVMAPTPRIPFSINPLPATELARHTMTPEQLASVMLNPFLPPNSIAMGQMLPMLMPPNEQSNLQIQPRQNVRPTKRKSGDSNKTLIKKSGSSSTSNQSAVQSSYKLPDSTVNLSSGTTTTPALSNYQSSVTTTDSAITSSDNYVAENGPVVTSEGSGQVLAHENPSVQTNQKH